MRKFLLLILCSVTMLYIKAQTGIEQEIVGKLDSIRRSTSVTSYFAGLYYHTTKKAVDFYSGYDQPSHNFIQRLENNFAHLFFRSADSFVARRMIPYEWKTYYSHSLLTPLQYELIGINAHINGDIWQALTSGFTLAEIRDEKKTYFDFQKKLVSQYNEFYNASLNAEPKIRLLHRATLGLDLLYGKWMLKRWRKRQIRIAIEYFTDKDSFNRSLARLHRKMERIDAMILRFL
jgi:hypothetical protein